MTTNCRNVSGGLELIQSPEIYREKIYFQLSLTISFSDQIVLAKENINRMSSKIFLPSDKIQYLLSYF